MLKRISLVMVFILMLAVPAFAKEAPERTIVQVTGSSEKQVDPDVAKIQILVNTINSNIEKAKNTNTASMNKVVAALREQGITDRDYKTDTYNIEPVYEYEKDKLPSLKGYRVTNRIEVTAPVEKVGILVDVATKAGANEISSIQFESKNEKDIKNAALQEAVKDAMKKAEVIAGALNKKIADVKLVNESGVYYRPVMLESRAFKAAADYAPSINAGKITVGANVQVTVELAD
ncbi:MAG: SIMPL domain-containing protein [Veillonellaceae bacterium]|nr:SIMPL domain-containing protein [Veillonellaceae bacterium]